MDDMYGALPHCIAQVTKVRRVHSLEVSGALVVERSIIQIVQAARRRSGPSGNK